MPMFKEVKTKLGGENGKKNNNNPDIINNDMADVKKKQIE